MVIKSGRIAGDKDKAQHVDLYRKLLLRKQLLPLAQPGAAYVPFIGNGDIATELYSGYEIYGADLDPQRVATASGRLPGAHIITANCDGWPFPNLNVKISLADFDSYSDPYASFRAFWKQASKSSPLILFFTDGHGQGIMRTAWWHKPDGSKEKLIDTNAKRAVYNFYFPRHIKHWFVEHIQPWQVVKISLYRRGMMLYWGAVVQHA